MVLLGRRRPIVPKGQWALHKNEQRINLLWLNCGHLNEDLRINIEAKLQFYQDMLESEFVLVWCQQLGL